MLFFKFGILYLNGKGVQKDFLKAKKYHELSSELNNPSALFYMGNYYSNGDIFNIDLMKAIKYFLKSIQIKSGMKVHYDNLNEIYINKYEVNNYRYISYNNLGLIYLIDLNDIEKAEDNIKESAFTEFPFGQNNFGLFNQFYFICLKDNKKY